MVNIPLERKSEPAGSCSLQKSVIWGGSIWVQFVFGQRRQSMVQDRFFHDVSMTRTQLNGCFHVT